MYKNERCMILYVLMKKKEILGFNIGSQNFNTLQVEL